MDSYGSWNLKRSFIECFIINNKEFESKIEIIFPLIDLINK